MRNSILLFLILSSIHIYAQTADEKLDQLDNIGLYPFPVLEDLKNISLNNEWIETSTIKTADISSDFSNINDLQWLKPHSLKNKVVMLGENHYYKFTQHIRNRMFFALNTFDHYPLIILENQYSLTGFVNHYLSLADENEAISFLQKELNEIIHNEESKNLLQHIRKWNILHPNKKLYVGYSDVEHDSKTTFKKLIVPYFQKIDFDLDLEIENITIPELKNIIVRYRQKLVIAKQKNLIGRYPFITPDYIETVLDNLESFYKCKNFDFNFYRQKAMVRNITEMSFLGKYWLDKKVFIHAGAYHTPNHFEYPDGGNFYREGSYLSFDFPYTKGKTYSIRIEGRTKSLGKMTERNLEKCMHSGWYYRKGIEKFQKAYKKKLIKADEYYFESKMGIFDSLILKKALMKKDTGLLVDKLNWKSILEKKKQDSKSYKSLKNIFNTYKRYDAYIYVVQSPFTVARLKPEHE